MQFTTRKRRSPPAIIIVSLIDVLIVVLIFLIVTTTFKQQPNIKLALPESKQSQEGSSENVPLMVTIQKNGTLYFGKDPVTIERLHEKLIEAVRENPEAIVAINADEGAPWGRVLKVMDAAKTANIKTAKALTKSTGQP